MEDLIDKIIAEITSLSEKTAAEGGIADYLELRAVYFGDPGIIPQSLYPCCTVEAVDDDPDSETTSADRRDHRIVVSLHIDARNYFDSGVDEATGDRMLVQATSVIRDWFRRRSKRTLDGMTGVHDLSVGNVAYRVQNREPVITKTSRISLGISRSYARVLD